MISIQHLYNRIEIFFSYSTKNTYAVVIIYLYNTENKRFVGLLQQKKPAALLELEQCLNTCLEYCIQLTVRYRMNVQALNCQYTVCTKISVSQFTALVTIEQPVATTIIKQWTFVHGSRDPTVINGELPGGGQGPQFYNLPH